MLIIIPNWICMWLLKQWHRRAQTIQHTLVQHDNLDKTVLYRDYRKSLSIFYKLNSIGEIARSCYAPFDMTRLFFSAPHFK